MRQKARLKRIETQTDNREPNPDNLYMDMPLAEFTAIATATAEKLRDKPVESLTDNERYILEHVERLAINDHQNPN